MNVVQRLNPDRTDAVDFQQEIGSFHRFGPRGVVYEVIGAGIAMPNGDREMRIRVLESGEVTDYPLSCVRQDPREA